ncbi:MAG: sugar phosphate isomerase/epimerase [Planctomycetes bacterium]|nr:sugar phosphate isomerase/epimerase [Planctomycetota bacterium]
MSALKVGVFLDNMKLAIPQAMDACCRIGADGFQIFVIKGEMLAENMTKKAREDFRKAYESRKLVLSATCCDFSVSFDKPQAREMIPKYKAAVDQAVDLGTKIITTHIGHVPADLAPAVCDPMQKVIEEVGRYAQNKGVTFATETGPESGATLAALLDGVQTRGVGANFDPANLVMKKFDHLQSLRDLKKYVVHAHAKDGKKGNGEVPLGAGDVGFPKYMALMKELGIDVFHVIEREAGPDPLKDMTEAIKFLRSLPA